MTRRGGGTDVDTKFSRVLTEKYVEFSSEPFNMRYSADGESQSVMAEKFRSSEQMLELSEDEANSPEHLDSQVQKSQDQLLSSNASKSRSKNKSASWKN